VSVKGPKKEIEDVILSDRRKFPSLFSPGKLSFDFFYKFNFLLLQLHSHSLTHLTCVLFPAKNPVSSLILPIRVNPPSKEING